jgi:hypothetical protein
MNAKALAKNLAGRLGSKDAILLLASELLRHVDMTKVTAISQVLRQLTAEEKRMDKEKVAAELVQIAKELTAAENPKKTLARAKKFKSKLTDALMYVSNNISVASSVLQSEDTSIPKLKSEANSAVGDIKRAVKTLEGIMDKLEKIANKKK